MSVFHPREDGLTAVAGAPWLHATIGETKALPTDTFRTDISLRADAIEGPDRRETTLLVQERGGERYSCNVRVAQETVSSVQLVPPALRLTDSASHVVRVARPASARGTSPARDVRVLSAPEGLHVELLRDASSGATSISVRRDRDLVAGEVEVSADDTVLYLPVVSAAGAPLR